MTISARHILAAIGVLVLTALTVLSFHEVVTGSMRDSEGVVRGAIAAAGFLLVAVGICAITAVVVGCRVLFEANPTITVRNPLRRRKNRRRVPKARAL